MVAVDAVTKTVPINTDRLHDKPHGTTTLAFIFQGGLIVATDSRATAGDYIMDPNVTKAIKFNERMVGTMAGTASGCQFNLNLLAFAIKQYEAQYGIECSIRVASRLLLPIAQMARSICAHHIAGFTGDTPEVYQVYSTGKLEKMSVSCNGSGSLYAYPFLRGKWHYELSVEEAIKLGAEAIYRASMRDPYSGNHLHLYHISREEGAKYIHELVPFNQIKEIYNF